HGRARNTQRGVDAKRLGISHQHREKDVGAEVAHVVQWSGVQVLRLTLRADQAGVEEWERVATDLHPGAGSGVAGDDVVRSNGLRLLPEDARPDSKQTVGRRARPGRAVVRDAAREEIADRNLEGNREDVEPGEDVFSI